MHVEVRRLELVAERTSRKLTARAFPIHGDMDFRPQAGEYKVGPVSKTLLVDNRSHIYRSGPAF